MSVFEVFSARKRKTERGTALDVYTYDTIPEKLRVQFKHVLWDAFGNGYSTESQKLWARLEHTMARSEGVVRLYENGTPKQQCERYLENSTADQTLDLIEIASRMMEEKGSKELIEELNYRFGQNDVGYQFENSQIVRIDNQYIHAEVIKPAVSLLSANPAFQTANMEFMKAHKHYRDGSHQDAVVGANRAFESTLKAICSVKSWPYDNGMRATDLIRVVRVNGLFPEYLDNAFDSYIAAMKSGLPGVRNNAGGHGPAPGDAVVPNYIAAYAIHLSAANIVIAIKAANI
jgi:hypothetical protein